MKKVVIEVVVAILFVLGGMWIVEKLERNYSFLDWRYKLHQKIHTYAAQVKGKPIADQNTIVVLIGDNEFWKGDYAGRTPTNEDSLAKLIGSLSKLKPRVIALDFNFCSQTMDGSLLESDLYQKETKAFLDAVRGASSQECTVVLTRFLHIISTPDRGYYVALPNKFDGVDPGLEKIARFGHINLPFEHRIIPPRVILKDGSAVDSFSQAIVDAFRLPENDPDIDSDDDAPTYCGAYLDQSKFVVHYADEIVKADDMHLGELRRIFAGKIVIVGAGWTEDAAADPNDRYTPVSTIDSQNSPAGEMPAVFVHANWVESILAGRTGRQFSKLWLSTIEFCIGFLSFLLFRGWIPWLQKTPKLLLLFQIAYFPVVVLFWILVSYLGFQNFGFFIDPVTSLVGALLALTDRAVAKVWEWRKIALQNRPANA
jgi:hypothetical protein